MSPLVFYSVIPKCDRPFRLLLCKILILNQKVQLKKSKTSENRQKINKKFGVFFLQIKLTSKKWYAIIILI